LEDDPKMGKVKNGTIRVLFASSEAEPFYKVGGLGDYSGSLPNALANLSLINGGKIDIRVVLPLHDPSTIDAFSLSEEFSISFDSRSGKATGVVYSVNFNGITYYFIRQIKPEILSIDVYDSNQYTNALKFAFFSIGCIKMLSHLDWQPDILHANDWHSALIIHQLDHSQIVNDKGKNIRTVLAIHNMPFMGSGSEKILQNFGINPISINTIPEWAQHLPLPMGIVSADKIVAVSPTYAEELKTNYFAYGLENYFIDNTEKLTGIINGIDTQQWDPTTDKFILRNFSLNSIRQRNKNKYALIEELGLDTNTECPLLIVISRLENQKGIDQILDALTSITNLTWNAIILGSGHHGYEHAFRALEREQPSRIRAFIEYNATLARKLYSSGDMILMPSLYEPCGLSQMIAMRYGCVPIAHAVGGLKDSIIIEPETKRTGFLFDNPTSSDFIACLKTALNKYQNIDGWKMIQMNGMKMDYSWNKSAKKYGELYYELLSE
jgi:starch synthase